MTYSKDNFEQLSAIIVDSYGFTSTKIHENVIEFSQESIPILRIIYNDMAGDIIICFHIATPSVEAIQMFGFITEKYRKVKLGENYFESRNGLFVGQDAHVEYESYLEQYFVQNHQVSNTEENVTTYQPSKEHPVTLVVSYPLYEASDDRAWEAYEEFKKRKKNSF